MKKITFSLLIVMLFTLLCGSAFAGWSTQVSTTAQKLNAIYLIDNAKAVAVGDNGAAIKTTDGKTWVTSPSGLTANCNDVFFPSLSEGYILANGGNLVKSTDTALTFSSVALPGVGTANLLKGSSYSTTRIIAASNGDAAGLVFLSSDSGANWTPLTPTNLDPQGVYLSMDDGGAFKKWVWGKYYAGGDKDKYAILQLNDDNTLTQKYIGTLAIKDIIFADKNTGYAVGQSGLILKTENGGTTWAVIPPFVDGMGTLNAVYFITTNFGWVVGDGGMVSLTDDGGANWQTYTALLNNINDVFVRADIVGSTVQAYAYLAGNAGSIYNLTGPSITAVTPAIVPSNGISTIEVTGTGFLSGAVATFDSPSDIRVLGTNVLSDTSLTVDLLVGKGAASTLRDLQIVNMDGTTSTEAGVITIFSTGEAQFSTHTWFDSSNLYYPATIERLTISQTPRISFEVTCVASPAAVSNSLKLRLVRKFNGVYHNINPTTFTATKRGSGTDSTFECVATFTLPSEMYGASGEVLVGIENDTKTSIGYKTFDIYVGSTNPTSEVQKIPGSTTEYGGFAVSPPHVPYDPHGAGHPVVIQLPAGRSVDAIDLVGMSTSGQVSLKETQTKGSGAAGSHTFASRSVVNSATGAITTKLATSIKLSNPQAGMMMLYVTDHATGKVIAKNMISILDARNYR
ncbi:MAG: YCF48-related protein [Candidatus Margulisiibacteriota bacterium]